MGAEPSGGHQAEPLCPAAPAGTPRAPGVAQDSAAPCATVPGQSPGVRHGPTGTASSTPGSSLSPWAPPCPPGLLLVPLGSPSWQAQPSTDRGFPRSLDTNIFDQRFEVCRNPADFGDPRRIYAFGEWRWDTTQKLRTPSRRKDAAVTHKVLSFPKISLPRPRHDLHGLLPPAAAANGLLLFLLAGASPAELAAAVGSMGPGWAGLCPEQAWRGGGTRRTSHSLHSSSFIPQAA